MFSEIVRPMAVLVAWSLAMWIWMYATRIPAMLAAKIDTAKLVGTTGADIRGKVPAGVQWKADNYNHLMEQPTIFYAACTVLALTGSGFGGTLVLAWAYVGFRIAHSLVQVTINRVMIRFALHVLGTLPLIWLSIEALIAAFTVTG